jgi:predicted MFS family arabinose efflux permease
VSSEPAEAQGNPETPYALTRRLRRHPLPRERDGWAPLAGVIAAVSVFAIAQGLSYPLLAFILERQGHSASAIGLSAAMLPLGLIASSALIPPIIRRFGPGPVGVVCALLGALLLALIGWTQSLAAWFPLRFLVGVVIGPLYVVSEVWVIALSPPDKRGRIVGLYSSVLSAGFALGPASLILVGTEGWPPFLVGISAFLICALCLALLLPRLPRLDGGKDASLGSFLPLAPVLLLAVIVTAGVEQAIFSMFPVYGLSHGLDARAMSAMLAVLISGSIALQIPLGLAAERWTPRRVLAFCALAAAGGSLALPALIATPFAWPFVFLWGALAYGIYTMALAELGARFAGALLVAGNAAFALMWGVGGIAGPPAAGVAIDAIGREGFPLTLALICGGLAVAATLAGRRRN